MHNWEYFITLQVVDMTGPEAKVLSGYSSIGQKHAKPEEHGSHPGTFAWKFFSNFAILLCSHLLQHEKAATFLGPVYTLPFSNEDGTEMFHFGLPSTWYRFSIQHQMKTVASENT